MAGAIGKVYKERGDRWYIRLPGRVKILCDKEHRSFYSRQHADWTLAQIQGEIERGVFDPDFYAKRKKSLLSFSVYAEEWLGNCKRKVERRELSITYYGSLKNYVRNHFIPYFQDMSIREIRGKHIKTFYLKLEYSPKTLWNIMSALHKLFQDACDEEVIEAVPKFPLEFKASSLPEPQWKWASEEVQEEIFKHLSGDAYFMILFMACHATRPGEARALQHQDIDLENDVVTIQRAFSDSDLRPFTKAKRIRHIPLDPTWKTLYLERPRHIDPGGFVFTGRNGEPHGRNWARLQWDAAREAAGVAHITLYQGTRHSLASQAGNRGVPIQIISKFLGHSTLEQTKRYTHLAVTPLRQVQRKAPVKPLSAKKRK
ncbi:MAG: tyrosine-type recombinase/integrase [Pseudomonadota bacterium]